VPNLTTSTRSMSINGMNNILLKFLYLEVSNISSFSNSLILCIEAYN
jgi:hypothetical protein